MPRGALAIRDSKLIPLFDLKRNFQTMFKKKFVQSQKLSSKNTSKF